MTNTVFSVNLIFVLTCHSVLVKSHSHRKWINKSQARGKGLHEELPYQYSLGIPLCSDTLIELLVIQFSIRVMKELNLLLLSHINSECPNQSLHVLSRIHSIFHVLIVDSSTA